MIRKTLPRLLDMDQNTAMVLDLVKHCTFNHFRHNIALRYAVSYAILIVAEAANHLPPTLTDRHPDIPWRKLIAIGNKLRHEYFRIDDDVLWEIATEHFGPLHRAIKLMLSEAD